jgi:hypothetical protein
MLNLIENLSGSSKSNLKVSAIINPINIMYVVVCDINLMHGSHIILQSLNYILF